MSDTDKLLKRYKITMNIMILCAVISISGMGYIVIMGG